MNENWPIWVAVLCIIVLFIAFRNWRVSKQNKKYDETHYIDFNDKSLTLRYDDKKKSYLWSKLESITLHSNDKGPFEEDQFYELYFGGEDYLTLPAEFKGVSKLVEEYFLKLDGLDEKMFIEAMGTTSNKTFKIYVR